MTISANRQALRVDATNDGAVLGEADVSNWEGKVSEGRAIIEKVSKLKYEMARDRALLYVVRSLTHRLIEASA